MLQGLYLSLALSFLVIVAGALALPSVLDTMELESDVRHVAHRYLIAPRGGSFLSSPTPCCAVSSTPSASPA